MKLTELTLLALQTAYMQRDLTTQGMCAAMQGELREVAFNTYGLLMYQALAPTQDSPFYDADKDKGFAFKLKDTPFGNALLDELAWQFHVDFYDKSANFHRRKELVRKAIIFHRTKGTPQAVIDLLNTVFPSNTQLYEWFQYGGEPYHFKIVTSAFDSFENKETYDAFIKALDSVKNARSYLDGIQLFTTILNIAVNKIENNRKIEYTMLVGDFSKYTFSNGEALSFGIGEKAYSFI